MRIRALIRLSDDALIRKLTVVTSHERCSTTVVVACIAEFDRRRLYLEAGCPSMFDYCVTVLRLSEDAAYKRIRAARAAREFPAVLAMLADGRLNLSVVVLLAPHLTGENAGELLGAAALKRRAEVEQMLAQRFRARRRYRSCKSLCHQGCTTDNWPRGQLRRAWEVSRFRSEHPPTHWHRGTWRPRVPR